MHERRRVGQRTSWEAHDAPDETRRRLWCSHWFLFRPLRTRKARCRTVRTHPARCCLASPSGVRGPALVEKTRSVVTGGASQFSLEPQGPGTYAVTFTLPGSARSAMSIRRSPATIATVNADLWPAASPDDYGRRRSAGRRRDERAPGADAQQRTIKDVPSSRLYSSFRRLSRRSTCRATLTSAAPTLPSSVLFQVH